MKSLYWNTVSADLGECLLLLMNHPLFDDFRLVGGTALSLHLGHRLSVDIDFFSSGMQGSLNFDLIDSFLRSQYKYVSAPLGVPIGFGRSYLLGETSDKTIRIDFEKHD
jgi:hypothetical protein